jgi:hypothetical protein
MVSVLSMWCQCCFALFILNCEVWLIIDHRSSLFFLNNHHPSRSCLVCLPVTRLVPVLDPNGLSLGAGAVIDMFQLPPVALYWIAQSPLIFIMFLPRKFCLSLLMTFFYTQWVNHFLLFDSLTERLCRCVAYHHGFGLLVGFTLECIGHPGKSLTILWY